MWALERAKGAKLCDKIAKTVVEVWPWSWDRFPILNLLQPISLIPNKEDKWNWDLDANGIFTVKKLRELVDSKLLDAHVGTGSTLWCKLVPKKVNVFVWRLCKGGIPVKEVLYERGIDLDSRLCPKCCSDVESIKHCFFDCSISVRIWKKVSDWCGGNFQQGRSIEEMISVFHDNSGGSPLMSAREAVLWSSLYILWRSRNSMLFERGARIDIGELFFEIQLTSFLWIIELRVGDPLGWSG